MHANWLQMLICSLPSATDSVDHVVHVVRPEAVDGMMSEEGGNVRERVHTVDPPLRAHWEREQDGGDGVTVDASTQNPESGMSIGGFPKLLITQAWPDGQATGGEPRVPKLLQRTMESSGSAGKSSGSTCLTTAVGCWDFCAWV